MPNNSPLCVQEPADNGEIVFDSVGSFNGVQFGVLVRFPKFYQLSQNLLYWQRVERVIGTRPVDTNI